jgi:hypothetical protein
MALNVPCPHVAHVGDVLVLCKPDHYW